MEILYFILGMITTKTILEPLSKWIGQLAWLNYSGRAFDVLDYLLPDNLDRSFEEWESALTTIFMADFELTERAAKLLASNTLTEAKLTPFIRKRNG
jgi:hypothetical protein